MSRGQRKSRVGRVVSDKMQQTVIVAVEWAQRHRLYRKNVRRITKLVAHDEQNTTSIGDLVRIIETRPISKTKRWRVTDVLERRDIPEVKPIEIDAKLEEELRAAREAAAAVAVAEAAAAKAEEALAITEAEEEPAVAETAEAPAVAEAEEEPAAAKAKAKAKPATAEVEEAPAVAKAEEEPAVAETAEAPAVAKAKAKAKPATAEAEEEPAVARSTYFLLLLQLRSSPF